MVGMHARRYNAHIIGICYEGDLDEKGRAKYDYPDAQILGHRDLPWVTKRCPCFDAKSEYSQLNGNQK